MDAVRNKLVECCLLLSVTDKRRHFYKMVHGNFLLRGGLFMACVSGNINNLRLLCGSLDVFQSRGNWVIERCHCGLDSQ